MNASPVLKAWASSHRLFDDEEVLDAGLRACWRELRPALSRHLKLAKLVDVETRLFDAWADYARGVHEPHLDKSNRHRLRILSNALRNIDEVIGANLGLLKSLIGGPVAEGFLSHVDSIENWLSVKQEIEMEIISALSSEEDCAINATPGMGARPPAHAPRKDLRRMYLAETVAILIAAGERVSVSRRGHVDCILRLLVEATGDYYPVDALRLLRQASRDGKIRLKADRRGRASWAHIAGQKVVRR